MILRVKEYRALIDAAVKEAGENKCNCGDGCCNCGDNNCELCNSYR
jgi:hypothetical protein